MIFSFHNVIPTPLANKNVDDSKVWKKELEIDGSKNNLILSSSGKGKTSLMHFLLGIRKDFQGNIQFNGKDISSYSLNDWSNTRSESIAFIPQELELIDDLTLLENLIVKNELTNFTSPDKIESYCERLGIAEQMNQKAKTLSKGQQQRTSIIRALLQPFHVLVMDEPFSHLDKENIALASKLILERCQEESAGFIIASLGEDYNLPIDNTLQL